MKHYDTSATGELVNEMWKMTEVRAQLSKNIIEILTVRATVQYHLMTVEDFGRVCLFGWLLNLSGRSHVTPI